MKMKTEGFADLDKALADFTPAVGRGVLRRALKSAAEPIADLANSLAPVGPTGTYSKSFAYGTKLTKRQAAQHRRAVRDDKASVEGFVGTSDPAGVQQEFGNVNHGPQPALRPAWDAEQKKTVDRIGTELAKEIDKAAQRAARKAARLARATK